MVELKSVFIISCFLLIKYISGHLSVDGYLRRKVKVRRECKSQIKQKTLIVLVLFEKVPPAGMDRILLSLNLPCVGLPK